MFVVRPRQEPDIPLLSQVIKVCGLDCTLEQLNKAEMMVLKAHSWNVCVVTPIHFVDMYVMLIRAKTDDDFHHRPGATPKLFNLVFGSAHGSR